MSARATRAIAGGLGMIACLLSSSIHAQSDAHAVDGSTSVAQARPTFLVTDVAVGEGVGLTAETARDVLATRFGRLRDKIEVRSLAEAKATVDQATLQQLLGNDSGEALSHVQDYVQVDRIVFGRITQVGGVVDLQVRVFNVKEGVVEVAFARRLGAGAPSSVLLALLDSLADSLTAWVLRTYGDDTPDASYVALQHKKLGGKKPEAPSSSSPWSALGVAGGVGAGLGIGAVGAGVLGMLDTGAASAPPDLFDITLTSIGGVVAVAGVAAVVVDGLGE